MNQKKWQIRHALQIIKSYAIKERVEKIPEQAEAKRFFSYPFEAIEEALVNAVYHKSYEEPSPIEVRINQNEINIISYPGPLPPLNKDNLNNNSVISRKYRNSRIGDFLKELKLTEGKNTGLSKIKRKLKQNGSPKPIFETDEDRIYFITKIKIHKAFESEQVEAQVEAQVDKKILKQLSFSELSSSELLKLIGNESRSGYFKKIIKQLLNNKLIQLTIPDKPKSPNQKYKITKKGLEQLKNN